jgi:hypothetical protein
VRGFWLFCVLLFHASCLLSRLALFYMCACEVLCDMSWFFVYLLYHVTSLVDCSYALLLHSTPISYELYNHVLTLHVLSYEYTLLGLGHISNPNPLFLLKLLI